MLGERLYQLRRSRGMSQEQLAERIGVSRQTISKWEGGLSTPDLEKLIALADCFEITMDELVRGHGVPVPPSAAASQQPMEDPLKLSRIAGFLLCVLGLLCLTVAVLILLLHPQTMGNLGGSFAITIDGSGMVYGMCVLAVVVGVYLIVRKP